MAVKLINFAVIIGLGAILAPNLQAVTKDVARNPKTKVVSKKYFVF